MYRYINEPYLTLLHLLYVHTKMLNTTGPIIFIFKYIIALTAHVHSESSLSILITLCRHALKFIFVASVLHVWIHNLSLICAVGNLIQLSRRRFLY